MVIWLIRISHELACGRQVHESFFSSLCSLLFFILVLFLVSYFSFDSHECTNIDVNDVKAEVF